MQGHGWEKQAAPTRGTTTTGTLQHRNASRRCLATFDGGTQGRRWWSGRAHGHEAGHRIKATRRMTSSGPAALRDGSGGSNNKQGWWRLGFRRCIRRTIVVTRISNTGSQVASQLPEAIGSYWPAIFFLLVYCRC